MDSLEDANGEELLGVWHCSHHPGSPEYVEYQEDRANIIRLLKKAKLEGNSKDVEKLLKAGTSLSTHQKAVLLSFFEKIVDPSGKNNQNNDEGTKNEKSLKQITARSSKSDPKKKITEEVKGELKTTESKKASETKKWTTAEAKKSEAKKSPSASLPKKAARIKSEKLEDKKPEPSGPKVSFVPDSPEKSDKSDKPEKPLNPPDSTAVPKKKTLKKSKFRARAKSADSLSSKDKLSKQEKDDQLMKDILEYFENPDNMIKKTPSQIALASRPIPVLPPIRRRKNFRLGSKTLAKHAKSASSVNPTIGEFETPGSIIQSPSPDPEPKSKSIIDVEDSLTVSQPQPKKVTKSPVSKSSTNPFLYVHPPKENYPVYPAKNKSYNFGVKGQRPSSASASTNRESRVPLNKVGIGKFINLKRVQKNEPGETKKVNLEVNAALNVQHKLREIEKKRKSANSLRKARIDKSNAFLDSLRPSTSGNLTENLSAGDKDKNGNELEDILKSSDSKMLKNLLDQFEVTPFAFEKKQPVKEEKKPRTEILKKSFKKRPNLSKPFKKVLTKNGQIQKGPEGLTKPMDLNFKKKKVTLTPEQAKLMTAPAFPKFPICKVLPGTKEWEDYWEKFNSTVSIYYREMDEYSRAVGSTHEEDIKAYSEKATRMNAENALFKQSLGLNPKSNHMYRKKISKIGVICGYVVKNNLSQSIYATTFGGNEMKLEIDIRNIPLELIKIDNEFNLMTIRFPGIKGSPPQTLKLGVPAHVTTKDVQVSYTDEFLILEGSA